MVKLNYGIWGLEHVNESGLFETGTKIKVLKD